MDEQKPKATVLKPEPIGGMDPKFRPVYSQVWDTRWGMWRNRWPNRKAERASRRAERKRGVGVTRSAQSDRLDSEEVAHHRGRTPEAIRLSRFGPPIENELEGLVNEVIDPPSVGKSDSVTRRTFARTVRRSGRDRR